MTAHRIVGPLTSLADFAAQFFRQRDGITRLPVWGRQ